MTDGERQIPSQVLRRCVVQLKESIMCPHQEKLIGLFSGQLTVQARDELLAHVRSCTECAAAYAELKRTWDVLGDWEVRPPARDLAPTVLSAARRRSFTIQIARIAAAIIIAGGAGIAAAMLMPPPQRQLADTSPLVAPSTRPSDDDVIAAMSLDALANDPTAFAEFFEDKADDGTEEGSL